MLADCHLTSRRKLTGKDAGEERSEVGCPDFCRGKMAELIWSGLTQTWSGPAIALLLAQASYRTSTISHSQTLNKIWEMEWRPLPLVRGQVNQCFPSWAYHSRPAGTVGMTTAQLMHSPPCKVGAVITDPLYKLQGIRPWESWMVTYLPSNIFHPLFLARYSHLTIWLML